MGIIDILVIITLVISNLMIGSPLRYNIEIPSLIITIVAIIYFIFAIKEKRKIELNRFDVFVIALSLTTLIPIFAKSYIRFKYTLEYVLRYMSALNIYLIIKQYLRQDKCKINIIVNFIVIISVILIIFGIDMMSTKIFDGFYNFIKVPSVKSESKERMLSLFKYPNTFCVYIGIALFVTIGAFLNHKNNKKSDKIIEILYANAIFMQLFAIVMTFSRLGWILIFALMFIYLICLKDRWKNIVKLLLISGINMFIYFCIFNKTLNSGNFLLLWGLFFVQNIVQFIVFLYLDFFESLLKKVNKKIFIAIFFVGFIFFIIWYYSLPNELVLFNSSTSQKQYRKTDISVEGNKEYKFKINLTTKTNKENTFKIYINEFNENEENIKENITRIDNIDKEIEIVVKTSSETKTLALLFKCLNPDENTEMIVHSVKLNDKELKVYYKLLPITLVTRIENIKFDSSSVNTRIKYIKQSIKVAKQNPIFGLGGYAWRGFLVDDIDLQSVAEHCYPLQLLMQNGIVSVWIYIYLIFMIIEQFIKTIKKNERDVTKISFFMSLFFILLHNIFDFDMYFLVILIDMYICLAIINIDVRKELKGQKIIYWIYGIFLVFLLYFSIGETISMRYDIEKVDESKKLNTINTHLLFFPYDYQYYQDKILLLLEMKEKGESLEGKDIDEEINKCLNFIENVEKAKLN